MYFQEINNLEALSKSEITSKLAKKKQDLLRKEEISKKAKFLKHKLKSKLKAELSMNRKKSPRRIREMIDEINFYKKELDDKINLLSQECKALVMAKNKFTRNDKAIVFAHKIS